MGTSYIISKVYWPLLLPFAVHCVWNLVKRLFWVPGKRCLTTDLTPSMGRKWECFFHEIPLCIIFLPTAFSSLNIGRYAYKIWGKRIWPLLVFHSLKWHDTIATSITLIVPSSWMRAWLRKWVFLSLKCWSELNSYSLESDKSITI